MNLSFCLAIADDVGYGFAAVIADCVAMDLGSVWHSSVVF